MPIMELCGIGKINEGVSSKPEKKGQPFKMQDIHFSGQSMSVEGVAVEKVTLNHLQNGDKLPEIVLGSKYLVELTDKGFLRNLELLEKSTATSKPATMKLNNQQ